MKRHLSISLLSVILLSCCFIGFTAFQYSPEPDRTTLEPARKSHHSFERKFGFLKERLIVADFGTADCYSCPANDSKFDNTNFQLIHWDQLQYFNKL